MNYNKNYYKILSTIADGIISVDKDGNIIFINKVACEYTGWNENNAINQPLDLVLNVIDPKTRIKKQCPFTQLINACEKTSFKSCPILVSKTGTERYISINIALFSTNEGQFSGAVLSFRDITCHRNIEEQLIIERQNLRSQFQYSSVPMIIIDKKMIVVDANDSYMDLLGGNGNGGIIGKTLRDSLGCVVSIKDLYSNKQYNRCHIERSVLKVIKSRIPIRDVERKYSFMQSGKEKVCNLKFNYIPINTNGYINVLLSIDDMTEFRVMEEGYKKSINIFKKYELLLEKARDIILVFKTDGKLIEVNEAAVKTYGYSRKELLNMTIFDIRKNDEHVKAQMEKALAGGIFFQSLHHKKDGSSFPVEASVQSTMLGDTPVIVSIIRDITERKKIEEKMQRAIEETKAAYKAKSEFLANMSHEIRTPLNGIIGMIDLTALTKLSYEQRDNLLIAKNCANSLLKIINDILDFSKMEAGKLDVENIEFDFNIIMERILKAHYYSAKEKRIELTYQLPIGIPPLLIGDPHRLQQILNNLLNNAIKFTNSGYVSLIIKKIGSSNKYVELEFSVIDTGIGISKQDMKKIFDSFSQADGSRTREYGGTGLGLVISKQLIEMMGGQLKVKSKKEIGSTFSFILKFAISKQNNGDSIDTDLKPITKTKKEATILLVEDDEINRTVISRMLKELGYKFETADNGKTALKMLDNRDYDLCLMDIQMPGMDGIRTTAIIRQKQKTKEKYMPIIALTAHALYGDKERFLAAGMDEYLAKPFQITQLFFLIEKLLEKHKQISVDNCELSTDISFGISEINSYIKNYAHKIRPISNEIKNYIDKLKLIIEKGDTEEIEEVAYKIKELASSISAEKTKNLAFRIQLSSRRGDLIEAEKLCKDLNDLFEQYILRVCEMEEQNEDFDC